MIRNPYIRLYDGKGFVGLYSLDTDKFLYSLRPDVIKASKYNAPRNKFLLHGLPKKNKAYMDSSYEQILSYKIKDCFFKQENIKNPFGSGNIDKAVKNKYLRRHHKVKDVARAYVNGIISESLKTADKNCLRIARRFSSLFRMVIYETCVKNERLKQLFDVDPFLAFFIAVPAHILIANKQSGELGDSFYTKLEQKKMFFEYALELVNKGEKLNKIYKELNWPKMSRKIKPGIFAEHSMPLNILDVVNFIGSDYINNYLPKTTMQQYRLFNVIDKSVFAGIDFSLLSNQKKDYIKWLIKVSKDFVNNPINSLYEDISYIEDYVIAQNLHGVRAFNSNMAYKTVKENNALWHRRNNEVRQREAQERMERYLQANEERRKELEEAERQRVEKLKQEIYPVWSFGDWKHKEWTIEHIKTGQELYEEGLKMHHCVEDYSSDIKAGKSIIFSLKQENERKATIELSLDLNLRQARGQFNASLPVEQKQIINKWLKEIKEKTNGTDK